MNCRELMNYLKNFDPDRKVVLFDEKNRPMEIEKVVIDSSNDGCLNHIVLIHIEE